MEANIVLVPGFQWRGSSVSGINFGINDATSSEPAAG